MFTTCDILYITRVRCCRPPSSPTNLHRRLVNMWTSLLASLCDAQNGGSRFATLCWKGIEHRKQKFVNHTGCVCQIFRKVDPHYWEKFPQPMTSRSWILPIRQHCTYTHGVELYTFSLVDTPFYTLLLNNKERAVHVITSAFIVLLALSKWSHIANKGTAEFILAL